MLVEAFLCIDSKGGLSKNGDINWHLPGDQRRLAQLIKPRVIGSGDDMAIEKIAYVMGRNTFRAMPTKDGQVITYLVLSSKEQKCVSKNGRELPTTSEDFIRMIMESKIYDRVVVLGGNRVYKFMEQYIDRLHVTQIFNDYDCDVIFTLPMMVNNAHKEVVINELIDSPNSDAQIGYTVTVYTNKYSNVNPYENQYIGLVKNRIDYGHLQSNRTATDTLSIFSGNLVANLRGCSNSSGNANGNANGNSIGIIPLLTTKKMGIKTIFTELCWFLNGMTDNKWLTDRNVFIWNSDAKRHGTDDLGKVYGYQWRNYNGHYDQVAECVRLINEDPTSRRIIINSWNPCDLMDMALPPCHVMYQFDVKISGGTKYLRCKMYQRSADIGLGLPFNLASVALLTHIMARVTGCIADSVEITIGNAHVYTDHVAALLVQVGRDAHHPPKIAFADDAPYDLDIGSWQPHHIRVTDYEYEEPVKLAMSGGDV